VLDRVAHRPLEAHLRDACLTRDLSSLGEVLLDGPVVLVEVVAK
jgi:hypothetical protein